MAKARFQIEGFGGTVEVWVEREDSATRTAAIIFTRPQKQSQRTTLEGVKAEELPPRRHRLVASNWQELIDLHEALRAAINFIDSTEPRDPAALDDVPPPGGVG
jgi:hypothetical protein